MTALIVDDEPLARARLKRLLEEQDVRVVGEADNAGGAIQSAEDLKPDLLFLDIKMPGLSGMQVASAILHLDITPLIVFVTGYSEYALDAFEHGALDYLSKPVSAERMSITLARMRERLSDRQARKLAELNISKKAAEAPPLRSLPVRSNFAVQFLALDTILFIFARDKKVYAQTSSGEHRTFYTLSQLETLLPVDRFVRIHDSSLVNLDAVVELLFLGDHTYEVRLTNRQLLRVGRTRYSELQRRLGLNNRPTV